MIITRSPLRISLGGGGTDLPSYYREHTGIVLAAAIDKYVYLTIHEPFVDQIILKYSSLEKVDSVGEVTHPIIREALRLVGLDTRIEIASMSDIPAGTGLGSSGSFTTALLRGLHLLKRNFVHPQDLAEQACEIEIDRLGEPIGKQDQYIAAFGGITCFTFLPNDEVKVEPLRLPESTVHNLEDGLALFFSGYTRSASSLLKDQDSRSRRNDGSMIDNLHFVKQLGQQCREALEQDDLHRFGELMHVHWEHKKKRSKGMSNSEIDRYYQLARDNGAIGGKVIGAGGGGFLMFYTENRLQLRQAMAKAGLREVRIRFDFEGTRVVNES